MQPEKNPEGKRWEYFPELRVSIITTGLPLLLFGCSRSVLSFSVSWNGDKTIRFGGSCRSFFCSLVCGNLPIYLQNRSVPKHRLWHAPLFAQLTSGKDWVLIRTREMFFF